MNIRLIGYGRLAKSLATIWHKHHQLIVSSPTLETKTLELGIRTLSDNTMHLHQQDLIVLAVKPKLITHVLDEIRAQLAPSSLIVSLAAGVTLDTLKQHTPHHSQVIRAMPNIAAEVGQSATLLLKSGNLSPQQSFIIEQCFQQCGLIEWVSNDEVLDLGTILAGSGPGYVFYMMRALQESVTALGMPTEIAKTLVQQTFLGASLLATHKSESLLELQQQVTSPKGTTAAALEVFDKYHLDQQLHEALNAAWQRVLELRNQQ